MSLTQISNSVYGAMDSNKVHLTVMGPALQLRALSELKGLVVSDGSYGARLVLCELQLQRASR